MGALFNYVVLSSFVLAVIGLVYKCTLAHTTFFRLNRFVLLFIYILAWVLPACSSLVHIAMSGETVVNGSVEISVMHVDFLAPSPANPEYSWLNVLLGIWLVGTSVGVISMIGSVWHLWRILHSGKRKFQGAYTEVITPFTKSPFSFARYVVFPVDINKENMDLIRDHELEHVRRIHWIDLLVGQLTVVLQWFSPIAWLMLRDVRDNHEYEVDDKVSHADPYRYQMMLIKMTVGSRLPVLADSLTHSKLKKRLTMMMTKKSAPSRRFAAIAIPASALATMVAIASPSGMRVSNLLSESSLAFSVASDISDGKVNNPEALIKIGEEKLLDSKAESPAQCSRVETSLSDNSAVVENSSSVSAVKGDSGDRGVGDEKGNYRPAVFVDGVLFNGDIKSISPDDISTMSVIKNDPAYPQGKIMVSTRNSSVASDAADDGNEKLYLVPKQIAEYRGGMPALSDALEKNLDCPESVKKLTRVIVQFTIDADGSVRDAKIVRSGGDECDVQALKAVEKTTGNWIPGQVDGKPVSSQFTLPVNFRPATEAN